MPFARIHDPGTLASALQLRHRVFRERLGWLPASPEGLDLDRADLDAVHLGVLDADGRLVAYCRLLLRPDTWMLDTEFRAPAEHDLAAWARRSKLSIAEVSRFCARDGPAAAELLWEGLGYARRCGLHAVVGVTDEKFFQWLRQETASPTWSIAWPGDRAPGRLPFLLSLSGASQ